MKISRFSILFRYIGMYIYLFMSKIHWGPREKAIMNMLDKISEAFDSKRCRIVDIGCGPGLLAKLVKKRGFNYLGLDNNLYLIQYCQEVYSDESGIEFTSDGFDGDSIQFTKNDIIILNGVVHHLDDSQMDFLLKKTSLCFAVIIADHLRKSPNLSLSNFLPFILQSLDRGKFVRLYKYFENFNNYNLNYSEEFSISVVSITFWTYFCNFYKPRLK